MAEREMTMARPTRIVLPDAYYYEAIQAGCGNGFMYDESGTAMWPMSESSAVTLQDELATNEHHPQRTVTTQDIVEKWELRHRLKSAEDALKRAGWTRSPNGHHWLPDLNSEQVKTRAALTQRLFDAEDKLAALSETPAKEP